jgi:hypothetical protein
MHFPLLLSIAELPYTTPQQFAVECFEIQALNLLYDLILLHNYLFQFVQLLHLLVLIIFCYFQNVFPFLKFYLLSCNVIFQILESKNILLQQLLSQQDKYTPFTVVSHARKTLTRINHCYRYRKFRMFHRKRAL